MSSLDKFELINLYNLLAITPIQGLRRVLLREYDDPTPDGIVLNTCQNLLDAIIKLFIPIRDGADVDDPQLLDLFNFIKIVPLRDIASETLVVEQEYQDVQLSSQMDNRSFVIASINDKLISIGNYIKYMQNSLRQFRVKTQQQEQLLQQALAEDLDRERLIREAEEEKQLRFITPPNLSPPTLEFGSSPPNLSPPTKIQRGEYGPTGLTQRFSRPYGYFEINPGTSKRRPASQPEMLQQPQFNEQDLANLMQQLGIQAY